MNSEISANDARLPFAVIANITEQGYMAQRTYGTFQIAACRPGEDQALTRITPRTAVMDYGDKRTLPLTITAREIAEDICRELNSDAGEKSFRVFLSALAKRQLKTNCAIRESGSLSSIGRWSLPLTVNGNVRIRFSSLMTCNGARRPIWASKRSGITRRERRLNVLAVASA